MRIIFIASHLKTRLFYSVAQNLEAHGHSTYWLTPNQTWGRWLEEQGTAVDRILDVSRFTQEWVEDPPPPQTVEDLEALTPLETDSGLAMNDLIGMDRNLSQKPSAYALRYLAVCHRHISAFLNRHEIQVVFAEPTWAIELLTSAICRARGIHFFAPHTIRIPDGRFAFFEGHLQARMARIDEPSEAHRNAAQEFLDYFRSTRPKPKYWHLNNELPKPQANWLAKTLRHAVLQRRQQHRRDESAFTLRTLVRNRLRELFHSRMLAVGKPFDSLPENPPPFILYALHKQPEASIDVLGPRFSNQLDVIRVLSRSLPSGCELFVKEHRNCIGERSMKWYEKVKSIPNVRLIDPLVDSHDLLQRSKCVLTVSGTIAYEAALHGVPSATMALMFFGRILTLNGFNPYSTDLHVLLNQKPNASSTVEFMADVLANSFEGTISDPRSDPSCMSEANVEQVSKGFAMLLKRLSTPGSSKGASPAALSQ